MTWKRPIWDLEASRHGKQRRAAVAANLAVMPRDLQEVLMACLPECSDSRRIIHHVARITENPEARAAVAKWIQVERTTARSQRSRSGDRVKPWRIRPVKPSEIVTLSARVGVAVDCIVTWRDEPCLLADGPESATAIRGPETRIQDYEDFRQGLGTPNYRAPTHLAPFAYLGYFEDVRPIRRAMHHFYANVFGQEAADLHCPWKLAPRQRRRGSDRIASRKRVQEAMEQATDDFRLLLEPMAAGIEPTVLFGCDFHDVRLGRDGTPAFQRSPGDWVAADCDPEDIIDRRQQMILDEEVGAFFITSRGKRYESTKFLERMTRLGYPDLTPSSVANLGACEARRHGVNEVFVARARQCTVRHLQELAADAEAAADLEPERMRTIEQAKKRRGQRIVRCTRCKKAQATPSAGRNGRCRQCGRLLEVIDEPGVEAVVRFRLLQDRWRQAIGRTLAEDSQFLLEEHS